MHDIRYDALHDELWVTNPFAKAILAFRGGANGQEAPIRVIQGPSTQMGGHEDRLDVDPVNNEIFIPNQDSILVFPREANGDVTPIRVIRGENTLLHNVTSVVVDPVHNVIAVGYRLDVLGRTEYGRGGLLIFNRTDNGNVKPRGFIHGPKAGIARICQMQVYPPKGWIIITHPGRIDSLTPEDYYIGVWSINDNGDVPARWKLKGPKTMMNRPRGLGLDTKHKELIVADMHLNAVLTYYFPEIF